MRLVFTVLTVLTFGQLWSQSVDDYVKTIERLRSSRNLITKSSTDKTFVGAVTAYYHKDSLVLINTLTDAEAAGTETLYFIEKGILKKMLIVAATFDSNAEWKEYYSKHKSMDNCYKCHGKQNCIMTDITFGNKSTIVVIENKIKKELVGDHKEKMLLDVGRTYDELRKLVKELR